MYSALKSQGTIFRYGGKKSQVAFHSGTSSRQLILIGGLTDGLLSLPFAPKLEKALLEDNWSTVHAQFTSSYKGYGMCSLDQDADELYELIVYLKKNRGCEEFALLGHSTGTQDSIRFVKRYGKDPALPSLRAVILQGPVSDQESEEHHPETQEYIKAALAFQAAGKGEEIVMRDKFSDYAPVTARRYLSLYQRRGDDDMFSTYLDDSEMKDILGHMKDVNCFIVMSEKDEYIPEHIDMVNLGKRLVSAMGGKAKYTILKDSDHGITDENIQGDFIRSVISFLKETEP